MLCAVVLLLSFSACKGDNPTVNISNARRVVATGTTEDGMKYSIYSDNTAEITRYTGKEPVVTVPAMIDGKPVIAIGNNAFDFTSITDVTLPDSIQVIRKWAFSNCLKLTAINLPEGLTTIEEYAFYRCRSMPAFDLPDSIKTGGEYAFAHCNALTTFELPATMTVIPNGLFSQCAGLTSVTWQTDITAIGEYSFASCKALTSFTIPETVTSIGQWCFAECISMTNVYIPKSITSIPYYAFGGCKVLTEIHFGGTEAEWFAIKFDSRTFFQSCPHTVVFDAVPGESVTVPETEAPVTEAP